MGIVHRLNLQYNLANSTGEKTIKQCLDNCRYCGSARIIKVGHRDGQKKYRCKDCGKSQGPEDRRFKYSDKERKIALTLYLEGCGFRRIARIMSEMLRLSVLLFLKHFNVKKSILKR